jgi:hypothetical protein
VNQSITLEDYHSTEKLQGSWGEKTNAVLINSRKSADSSGNKIKMYFGKNKTGGLQK